MEDRKRNKYCANIVEDKLARMRVWRLGEMAHTCNPSTLGGWGGQITKSRDQDHPGQHGATPSLLKIQKNHLGMVAGTVIPATLEAKAGESLEPKRRRLQWAEIVPWHCTPAWATEWDSISKEKKKRVITISFGKCPKPATSDACTLTGRPGFCRT